MHDGGPFSISYTDHSFCITHYPFLWKNSAIGYLCFIYDLFPCMPKMNAIQYAYESL